MVPLVQSICVFFGPGSDALGLWDPETTSIGIWRDQLKTLPEFGGGVLLHEVAHARSGHGDVTRGFENELTQRLGLASAAAMGTVPASKKPFWR